MNKVILKGTIVSDLQTQNQGNNNYLSFVLQVEERGKDGQKFQHNIGCSTSGKRAEAIAKFFAKDGKIMICGRLKQRTYNDQNSGQQRQMLSVWVDEFDFAGKTGVPYNQGGQNYQQNQNTQPPQQAPQKAPPQNAPAPQEYNAPAPNAAGRPNAAPLW